MTNEEFSRWYVADLKKRRKNQRIIWILVAAFIMVAYYIVNLNYDNSYVRAKTEYERALEKAEEAIYKPTEMDAYIMSQQLLEDRLKAPSTADFAPFHKSTVGSMKKLGMSRRSERSTH